MLSEIEIALHRAENHRVCDVQLLRSHSEINVHNNKPDQPYASQPVQHIHPAPGHVTEQIWIPRKNTRAHAKHHEHACDCDCESTQHNYRVVELVIQRVLA